MGANSKIEWTDATWNPWQGCTKVSPACQHCYMFTDMKRYGRDGSVVHRSADQTFKLPLKKRRTGEYAIPPGSKVFTCSWSDWFHEVADAWRPEAWDIIRQRPDVTFQIVTKRTDRIRDCLPGDWGDGYPNVWLIATAENQEWLERRIAGLLSVPAVVHGLSIEPLLGDIKLWCLRDGSWYDREGASFYDCLKGTAFWSNGDHGLSGGPRLDWVIVGGESGPGARPMHPGWVRSIRDQCQAADVPFFFKQWGEWYPIHGTGWLSGDEEDEGEHPWTWLTPSGERCQSGKRPDALMIRSGKKFSGRMLDVREWSEFPEVIHNAQ